MTDAPDLAPYRLIQFTVRGPFCEGAECAVHPDLLPLRFEVTEVHGTSPVVREGERYVLRGTYELSGEAPFVLSVAVFGKAFGAGAHIRPGTGSFETSAEILKLADDPPNGLGVVVGNKGTGRAELVRWVMLGADGTA